MIVRSTIEVVGLDMQCFQVDAETLEPTGVSYYQPAAWRDPRGAQMGIGEWQKRRAEQSEAAMRAADRVRRWLEPEKGNPS